MRAELVCWHCDRRVGIEVSGPPQFAFEVADWANKAGMYGAFDMERGRTLVFCDEAHANEQRTKSGHFRLRPKRPNAQAHPTRDSAVGCSALLDHTGD